MIDRARAVVALALLRAAAFVFPDEKCRECACDFDVAITSVTEHMPEPIRGWAVPS